MTWRPADAPKRARPVLQPIVDRIAGGLTDDEQQRLLAHPALERYPAAEWLTKHERDALSYWRWWWTKRGYDR